jgi:EAL domain-containing protein (putative c-di-GMP-specific phosphodiesterase class I)
MQRADVAMYGAKLAHSGMALCDPTEDWNTADRLRLANELRQALDNGDLIVHYQPIARVSDGQITESGIMSDPDRMIGVLNELVAAGVQLAIDDFGTGYSSFSYLQQLPVSEVKIDKSFISPLGSNPSATSIVRSIIELGRNLNLAVIAEGVEDQRTLAMLRNLGCHAAQGYYFSKAIAGAELSEWMRARSIASSANDQTPRQRAHLRVV